MKIGITCDLREEYLAMGYNEEETAEFDRTDTIDAIETALKDMGYGTDRIGHAKNLVRRLAAGERWDLVFNIAEGMNGFGREALVPALLDDYRIPYTFSDPLVLSLTLHKAMAKRVVRDLGVPTPDFCVVETDTDIERVDLPLPLFVKPMAEGTGKGITAASKILDHGQLRRMCREMLATFRQPVLVERFLPGREFTVGIVGTGDGAVPLGVMEVLLGDNAEPDVYSYTNKENCEELVQYRLASDATAQQAVGAAMKAYVGLGCRDAGRVDIRADAHGVPNFIEINPLAGLHPEHSDLCIIATLAGVNYHQLIGAIVASATERCLWERKSHVTTEDWYPLQPAGAQWPAQLGGLGGRAHAG